MVVAIISCTILLVLAAIAITTLVCNCKIECKQKDVESIKIKCEHEVKLYNLAHPAQDLSAQEKSKPDKASESDTATFFRILNDPTVLYEEEDNNGATGDN